MRYLVQHALEASAASHPERLAVVDGERAITYEALDRRTNQVARQLAAMGIRRGDRVGLYLEKSLESIVGIYGILKAGAAYVPFDPAAPVRRLGYIARNADIRCVVTGADKAPQWPLLLDAGAPLESLVCLGAACEGAPPDGVALAGERDIDALDSSRPPCAAIELDLAYILYTSGSTGEPKGVMLSHRNALAFVEWATAEFRVTADDRLSSHAPLHFDLSVFDLFAAALAGARVVLVPTGASVFPLEIARFVRTSEISVWYSVPSILSLLALRGGLEQEGLPSLRTVLFAGEVFPTKHLRRLMGLVPQSSYFNLYGPTETNVCTFYPVPPLAEGDDRPIPIGRAITGVDVFAVADDGRIADPGEVGELWARGPTVMRGYWGDDERTARGLRPDPTAGLGDLAYRTGDLVRCDEAGDYHYLGRRDAQIKSRGYRIELGEIETALYAHPAVAECAAVAVPDEVFTNRIAARVVARSRVDAPELIAWCRERLPRYMVPETVELCDALPRTSTGKVDRQALARSPAPAAAGGGSP